MNIPVLITFSYNSTSTQQTIDKFVDVLAQNISEYAELEILELSHTATGDNTNMCSLNISINSEEAREFGEGLTLQFDTFAANDDYIDFQNVVYYGTVEVDVTIDYDNPSIEALLVSQVLSKLNINSLHYQLAEREHDVAALAENVSTLSASIDKLFGILKQSGAFEVNEKMTHLVDNLERVGTFIPEFENKSHPVH